MGCVAYSSHALVSLGEKTHTWSGLGMVVCGRASGFSWHGVVVRLDAMLCDVSLPSLTILH